MIAKFSSVLMKALRNTSPVPSLGTVPTNMFDKKGNGMEISIVCVIYSNNYVATVIEKGLLLAPFI
jgi:hypothetical protein